MNRLVFQFSTSTEWTSAIIRKLCHSPFSHVDLVLPDGTLLGASDSPGSPFISGNPRGVAIRPSAYQEFRIRRRAIIETAKADAVIAKMLTQLGKPFDSGGLRDFLSETMDRNWRDPEHWWCSELKAWSCEDTYWTDDLIWPKNRVTPTDFLLLFVFDANFVNKREFWQPVLGLQLGAGEK